MNKSMKFSERDIEEIVNRVYKEFNGDIKKAAKEMCLRAETISIYVKSQQQPVIKREDSTQKTNQSETNYNAKPEFDYNLKNATNYKTKPANNTEPINPTKKQIIPTITNEKNQTQNTKKYSLDRQALINTEKFAERTYRTSPFTKSFLFVLKRLCDGSTITQVEDEMKYVDNITKFAEIVIKTKLEKYQKEYNVTTPTQLYEKIFKQKT